MPRFRTVGLNIIPGLIGSHTLSVSMYVAIILHPSNILKGELHPFNAGKQCMRGKLNYLFKIYTSFAILSKMKAKRRVLKQYLAPAIFDAILQNTVHAKH